MVVESHRYRAHLRAREGAAHRARRDVDARRRERGGGARLRGAAARPHDRERSRARRRRRGVVPARPARAVHAHRPNRWRARGARSRGQAARPRARARRDRLPARCLPRTPPESLGRRADDVRAGELGALPAQDLQRGILARRREARALAVLDDPQHPRALAGRRALGVSRQRGRYYGQRGDALPRGRRDAQLDAGARAGAHRDQGRNA